MDGINIGPYFPFVSKSLLAGGNTFEKHMIDSSDDFYDDNKTGPAGMQVPRQIQIAFGHRMQIGSYCRRPKRRDSKQY